MKGCVFLLRKKAVVIIVLVFMLLALFNMPVFAQDNDGDNNGSSINLDFIKTITSVRYIGLFRHHKKVDFFGGTAEFLLGPSREEAYSLGEVGGTHRVISSVKEDLFGNQERKTHINVHFFGTTDDRFLDMMILEKDTLSFIEAQRQAAVIKLNQNILDANDATAVKTEIMNQMESETLRHFERQRERALSALNEQLKRGAISSGAYNREVSILNSNIDMAIAGVLNAHNRSRDSVIRDADLETSNILAEMDSINEYYDQLHASTKASFNVYRELNVAISSTISLDDGGDIFIGLNMDPGETGYIKQGVYTYSEQYTDADNYEGDYYLKINNRFKNTGGRTQRDLTIEDYIVDNMKVEGYAEVWETTEIKRGDTKTGWWDPNF